ERTTQAYGAAAQQFKLNHREYLAKKAEQAELRQQQQAHQEEIEQVRQRLEYAHNELVNLEARIQGIPALRDKQALDARRDELNRSLQDDAKPLFNQDQQRTRNFTALRNICDILGRHSIELELPA